MTIYRLVILVLTVLVGRVSSFSQEKLEAFHPNAKIVWAATNSLPERMAVYEKLNFSSVLLSNVMGITSLKLIDVTSRNTDETVFEKRENNRLMRRLKISATYDAIDYFDAPTNYSLVHGVPAFDDVGRLAMNCLRLLGGNTNEIANTKKPRTEGTVSNFNKKGGTVVSKNVYSRGITFNRAIDGIQVEDYFFVEFGNDAKVIRLQMDWRNLRLYKTERTESKAGIIRFIEAGQATILPDLQNGFSIPAVSKTVTITKVFPVYPKSGISKFVYPSVCLEITSDVGTTNATIFNIQCPIVSVGSSK